jgi:rRNA maturation protein Nop10
MRKTIALKSMRIQNFKGIKDLTVDFDGGNTLISGYNATGKSTLLDAYSWLLFNKNAAGDSRFELRPRNREWQEIHDIVTSVEATFELYSKPKAGDPCELCYCFTLKKTQIEDLTKEQRAALKPGDIAQKKNFYFIDDAPYPEKFFTQKVDELLTDEITFRLISSPTAFFAQDEKKQREMLFKACGTVNNENVEGYADVKKICGAVNTPETTRDALSKTITQLKKQAEEIPARVDSLSKLIDVGADYKIKITELEARGKDISERLSLLSEIQKEEETALFSNRAKNVLPPAPVEPNKNDINAIRNQIEDKNKRIPSMNKELLALSDYTLAIKCPQCGHKFFTDEAARDELKDKLGKKIIECKQETVDLTKNLIAAEADYNAKSAEYTAAREKYNQAVSEIAQEKPDTSTLDKIRAEIDYVRAERDGILVDLHNSQGGLRVIEQIDGLKAELIRIDEVMAKSLTDYETVRAYLKRKADLEMVNINKHFSRVEFKLFEMQANGEYKDVCKAVIDGVSYASQNTASKIQAGVEVTKLFSEYYGVSAPLWIDNKESVFDIPETDAQIICLKADRQKPTLIVEKINNIKGI